jgi:CBS domain-containing protein
MIDVPVSAVMTEAAPTVPPDTTAVEAARRLRRADVHAVVVSDGDALVGIVTESDIVAVVAEGGENPPVESFMSSPVVTATSTTPVGLAADRMRDAGVTRLPVVDSEAATPPRADGEAVGSEARSATSNRTESGDSVEQRSTSSRTQSDDSEDRRSSGNRPQAGADGRYRGLVTQADIAPYLSRHRLDVDWEGDPLSLDGTETPERSAD